MTQIIVRLTNVTEGWSTVDGVDVKKTNLAYAERFEAELRRAYPQAEITIETNPNVFGSLSNTIMPYEDADDIEQTLSAISDRLTNDSESWIVMANA